MFWFWDNFLETPIMLLIEKTTAMWFFVNLMGLHYLYRSQEEKAQSFMSGADTKKDAVPT